MYMSELFKLHLLNNSKVLQKLLNLQLKWVKQKEKQNSKIQKLKGTTKMLRKRVKKGN